MKSTVEQAILLHETKTVIVKGKLLNNLLSGEVVHDRDPAHSEQVFDYLKQIIEI